MGILILKGIGSCMFVWFWAENGLGHKKVAVDCALVIASIGETLFQTEKDQTMTMKYKHCQRHYRPRR